MEQLNDAAFQLKNTIQPVGGKGVLGYSYKAAVDIVVLWEKIRYRLLQVTLSCSTNNYMRYTLKHYL